MDVLIPLLIPVILAVLLPFANKFSAIKVEKINKERALERLKNDPFVKVGAWISELRSENSDKPLMEDCQITAFKLGYVEVREGKKVMNFTVQEFEKLHPIFDFPVKAEK